MERQAAAVLLLLLCVIIITTTEGFTPNCCIKTAHKIPRNLIRKADKYEIQSEGGLCEIKALILYVGKKKLCFDPKMEYMMKNKYKHAYRQN
ncbi:C-C motif chemokine 27a [Tachysurus fulvidraco]|uniref:C-C motif chemokine 27a n=1 Tax=Tachysurus fulvidraco TaxID=1234273 RepID=UPI001FEE5BE3|nr:C-C motif chemokine 27a [Tachysurus fulvidraco]